MTEQELKQLQPFLKHNPYTCPKKEKSYWEECDPGARCVCGLDDLVKRLTQGRCISFLYPPKQVAAITKRKNWG